MHDHIYQNDIFKLMNIVSDTALKWEQVRGRQEIYMNKVSGADESDDECTDQKASPLSTSERINQHQYFRVVKSKTEVRLRRNTGLRHHQQGILQKTALARVAPRPEPGDHVESDVDLGPSEHRLQEAVDFPEDQPLPEHQV
jgi:hypothetical protein